MTTKQRAYLKGLAMNLDPIFQIGKVIAERTHSQVVQVIGKKIVLYKEGKDKHKKIELPK